jgi:hypothetical protein
MSQVLCVEAFDKPKMPIGVIDIQLEMFPKPTKILGQEVLTAQLNMERSRQSEKESRCNQCLSPLKL